jgi:hypothetical protein
VTRLLLAASALAFFAAPALAMDHLPIEITADKKASWEVLCKIQSYKDANGAVWNRYGLHSNGSYRDVINSPNAECTMQITEGPGPVTMRIVRIGKKPFVATANAVGQKVQLSVF